MKYKITIQNQLKALRFIIVVFVFCCTLVYYGYIQPSKANMTKFSTILFLISFIPVAYLHIEYYLYNKDSSIEIDTSQNRINYWRGSNEIRVIEFDELDKILIYLAFPLYNKTYITRLPNDAYNFAKMILKSGEEIIITSLMVPKLEKTLSIIKDVPIEEKPRLYASIILQTIILLQASILLQKILWYMNKISG